MAEHIRAVLNDIFHSSLFKKKTLGMTTREDFFEPRLSSARTRPTQITLAQWENEAFCVILWELLLVEVAC